MFKKKGTNSKKVDLNQETEEIKIKESVQVEALESANQQKAQERAANVIEQHISNDSRTPIYRKKGKSNIFSLDGLQKIDISESNITNRKNNPFEEEKVASSEIQLCFHEIRKLKENEPIIEEDYQQVNSNHSEQQNNKNTMKMEEIDLEEQADILEIEVDEDGGFSPELNYGRTEDYDDVNGDYQDELIKKTLTRRNYENLGKYGGFNLNKLKQNEAKDSLIEKIKKVNASSIKKAISRDLYNKKIKLKELQGSLAQIGQFGGSKKKEIQSKQKRLTALKQQFEKVNKVIEYIYYWGDKINEFSVEEIYKQVVKRENRNNTFQYDNEEEF